MRIAFADLGAPKSGAYVVLTGEGGAMSAPAKEADKALGGAITRAATSLGLKGKVREIVDVPTPSKVSYERLLAVSIGDPAKFDARAAQDMGGAIYSKLSSGGLKQVSVACAAPGKPALGDDALAAEIAFGIQLAAYRFSKYRTKGPDGRSADARRRSNSDTGPCECPQTIRQAG